MNTKAAPRRPQRAPLGAAQGDAPALRSSESEGKGAHGDAEIQWVVVRTIAALSLVVPPSRDLRRHTRAALTLRAAHQAHHHRALSAERAPLVARALTHALRMQRAALCAMVSILRVCLFACIFGALSSSRVRPRLT